MPLFLFFDSIDAFRILVHVCSLAPKFKFHSSKEIISESTM